MTKKIDERQEELYLIKSFPGWPLYPLCPMINRTKRAEDGIPEVGFVLAQDVMAKKAIIYHENFSNLPKLKEKLDQIKKTEYKDFDEMFDNGWRVD